MAAPGELHDDWELLLGSDLVAGHDPGLSEPADPDDGGAIKPDYFSLDSDERYPRRSAGFDAQDAAPDEDSDNPSWIDPESNSQFLDRQAFGASFDPRPDLRGFWSDESSDGQRSHLGSEKGEIGEEAGLGGMCQSEETNDREEEEKPQGVGSGELTKGGRSSSYSSGIHEKKIGAEGRGVVWWKLPFELLKFCAFRVKPVWSISVAAAMLGVWMLGKRLYRMKQKTRSIHLNLSLDGKVIFSLFAALHH